MEDVEDFENLPPERRRDKIKALAKKAVTVPLWVRTSDLPKRAASAVVMLLIAGSAFWLGGWWWLAFVVGVALGVFVEWIAIVRRFPIVAVRKWPWYLGGLLYLATAGWTLIAIHRSDPIFVLLMLGGVIATDVGAYFAGRAIGGPKIAPRISPSKTWAGLGGAILAATALFVAFVFVEINDDSYLFVLLILALLLGIAVPTVAQAGDFFESWMKRRAGVKDSGKLIPGHGGLFDRVDGLLAVAFLVFPFIVLR